MASQQHNALATIPLADPEQCALSSDLMVTVLDGPDAGRSQRISGTAMVLGRSERADFFLRDPAVSLFHVTLQGQAHGISFRDLSSRNGVRVGGVRVDSGVLPSGGYLLLGGTTICIEQADRRAIPTAAKGQFGPLVGESMCMRQLYAEIDRFSRTSLAIYLHGETGTGKELVARAIHEHGPRRNAPFVILDCSTLTRELATSKLLGHERGAFTGATTQRAGVFEAANGGTLFIDEIGELPLELQPLLLRALEAREVIPVGGHRPKPVNVRVVCASHRDLRMMVNREQFREDLYHRLVQVRLHLPALRERPDDIPRLVQRFLSQISAGESAVRHIAPDALELLSRADYPGNLRDLRNQVLELAARASPPAICAADVLALRQRRGEPPKAKSIQATAPRFDAASTSLLPFKDAKRAAIAAFERSYLQALRASWKTLSEAAQRAGLERLSLRDLLKKHGMYEPDLPGSGT